MNPHTQTISHLDDVLRTLRGFWLDSKPAEKSVWMERINTVLDDRLKAMRLRDGFTIKTEA